MIWRYEKCKWGKCLVLFIHKGDRLRYHIIQNYPTFPKQNNRIGYLLWEVLFSPRIHVCLYVCLSLPFIGQLPNTNPRTISNAWGFKTIKSTSETYYWLFWRLSKVAAEREWWLHLCLSRTIGCLRRWSPARTTKPLWKRRTPEYHVHRNLN